MITIKREPSLAAVGGWRNREMRRNNGIADSLLCAHEATSSSVFSPCIEGRFSAAKRRRDTVAASKTQAIGIEMSIVSNTTLINIESRSAISASPARRRLAGRRVLLGRSKRTDVDDENFLRHSHHRTVPHAYV